MSLNEITLAQIEWINEDVPYSKEFDDIYFSTDDGIAESELNFIVGNNLQRQFAELDKTSNFRIAETGFGTGLNFLLAAELWLRHSQPCQTLHYISFEKYPLQLKDLAKSHQSIVKERQDLGRISDALQEQYPLLLPGWHDLYLFEKRIRLTLWFGDVLKGLPELDGSIYSKINSWFLDGFSPAKNPEMWQPALYQQMARVSCKNTTFATFTAAGEVRRGLEKVGFRIEKRPGFGRKRERCFGVLEDERPHSLKAPWFSRPTIKKLKQTDSDTAIVVGAGLAGAAIAHKLAEAGFKVVVLEAEKEVATQASGNLAGTLHPLITVDWNLRSQWYLQGFESTLRTLKPWLEKNPTMGDLSGLVELQNSVKTVKRNQQAIKRVGIPEPLMMYLDVQQTSDILGVASRVESFFFPKGGWLYPRAVVEKCLDHEHVDVFCDQRVVEVVYADSPNQAWKVKTATQEFEAENLVIATGSLEEKLNKQLQLPIRPVKGQVTHVSQEDQSAKLQKAVTHSGYSVSHPAGAVTGATFEAPDMSVDLSMKSQRENIEMAREVLPDWLKDRSNASYKETIKGRVAFRPTTPDHLPIVGPVPDFDWMDKVYLSQSHTHAVYRYKEQQYQPGLYVSNGHGPRGLLSVFLAAESIVADITGAATVQPLSLYHASHPARFTIRNWRSGK